MAGGRKRDFAAEYARRIAKAEAAGKTRQQARGHVEREHVVRAEREREAEGISGSERRNIGNWHNRWERRYGNVPGWSTLEELLDWVREHDYSQFQMYRDEWNAVRRQYVREAKTGTYETRGTGFLEQLVTQWDLPEMTWAYYH